MKTRKIISGEFAYCCRAMRSWTLMGYRIVKQKKWSDGKYTFVLEDFSESRTFRV